MKLFPLDYFMQQEFPQACYVKDPNHKLALSEKHILKPVLSRFIDNMSSLRTYVRSSGARSDRWRDLASTLGYGATSAQWARSGINQFGQICQKPSKMAIFGQFLRLKVN